MLLSPLGKGCGPSFEQLEFSLPYVGTGWARPLFWTNLKKLYPKMLYAKFGWNWPSGSGEKDFWILSIFFLLSPLVKGCGPSFEQTWIPFTHCWFVPRPSGSEEDFLIFSKDFLHFCYYLLLELSVAVHLNKVNPLNPNMLCANFGWNWSSGSGKKFFKYFQ